MFPKLGLRLCCVEECVNSSECMFRCLQWRHNNTQHHKSITQYLHIRFLFYFMRKIYIISKGDVAWTKRRHQVSFFVDYWRGLHSNLKRYYWACRMSLLTAWPLLITRPISVCSVHSYFFMLMVILHFYLKRILEKYIRDLTICI